MMKGFRSSPALWTLGVVVLCVQSQLIAAPKIDCPQPEFKFGEKESGTEVTAQFTIANKGDQTLEVSKVLPGCGCTSAKISQNAIPAGGEATITAILSLQLQKGPLRKDVTVKSNDPDKPELVLYMVGTAASPINVKPDTLALGEINAHVGGEYVIDLVAPTDEKKFQITGVDVGDKHSLSARYEEVEKEKAYRVHVSLGKDLSPGYFHSFVRIRTNHRQFRVIGIPVNATVTGELAMNPSEIKIFNPKDKDGATRQITIRPDKVRTFKVTEVVSPGSSVDAKFVAGDDGSYRVTVSNLKPLKELDNAILLIKTDVLQMNAIRVPIHVINTGHPPKNRVGKKTNAASKSGKKSPPRPQS